MRRSKTQLIQPREALRQLIGRLRRGCPETRPLGQRPQFIIEARGVYGAQRLRSQAGQVCIHLTLALQGPSRPHPDPGLNSEKKQVNDKKNFFSWSQFANPDYFPLFHI
jgi:hypothetical protein